MAGCVWAEEHILRKWSPDQKQKKIKQIGWQQASETQSTVQGLPAVRPTGKLTSQISPPVTVTTGNQTEPVFGRSEL